MGLSGISIFSTAARANSDKTVDLFDAIATRRSCRQFTDKTVPMEVIEKILRSAMYAPSALNEQPWEFIIIQDKTLLNRLGEANHNAAFSKNSPLAILVCLNENKVKAPGMAVVDMGMCAQNILLAAHGLGLGAVFTGIYPDKNRMNNFSELCGLPKKILPFGLIVLGYPKIDNRRELPDRFNREAIHFNKW